MAEEQRVVYLDHHATTPVDERVLEAMLPFFHQRWGNAASKDHQFGADAKTAVDEARAEIAGVIGARPDEIIFTSGATESNNLALAGLVRNAASDAHVVTSAIEHSAVLDCLAGLEDQGASVTKVPVGSDGLVDPADVREAIRDNTVVVSIMAANNEVGTVQPLAQIGKIAKDAGVVFHTDAAQALAYLDIDVNQAGIGLLSGSAHKFYGPKGVGFLYVSKRKPRVHLEPLIRGGGHERGMRSGTLNVPGIVGMAAALRLAMDERSSEAERIRELSNHMAERLSNEVGGMQLHGHSERRLPNNLNISFEGVRAKALIVNLPDVAFSTGSACTTQKAEPSHVLEAMGIGEEELRQAVRFGLGRFTTRDEVDYAVDRLAEVVQRLRSAATVSA